MTQSLTKVLIWKMNKNILDFFHEIGLFVRFCWWGTSWSSRCSFGLTKILHIFLLLPYAVKNYRVFFIFLFFFASFYKGFWQVANYFWSCSIFLIWSHLSFFMMNWKDYKLSKYTIIGEFKCMLYQINLLWLLFFKFYTTNSEVLNLL